jgi:hypothetical protein
MKKKEAALVLEIRVNRVILATKNNLKKKIKKINFHLCKI